MTRTTDHALARCLSGRAFLLVVLALRFPVFGQTTIHFDDLSPFVSPSKSWVASGNVRTLSARHDKFVLEPGTGVIAHIPSRASSELITKQDHHNIDLSLEFMMTADAECAISLLGMYDLRLSDVWSEDPDTRALHGSLAYSSGVYAPRQYVGRAPGLWQHLEISFDAPELDEQGEKIRNALIRKVILNGVTIHEDVELVGSSEKESGPLIFKPTRGSVAFRQVRMTSFDRVPPLLQDLAFTAYEGASAYDSFPVFDSFPEVAKGARETVTSDISGLPQRFLIHYVGSMKVDEAGEYVFRLNVGGGKGYLSIAGNPIIPFGKDQEGTGTIYINRGTIPFELIYAKYVNWSAPSIDFSVSGPGLRETSLTDDHRLRQRSGGASILVNPVEQKMLRSFMDIPGGHRLTHAISVSSSESVHYTYDLSRGTLVQVWRGDFLDATPMWRGRGDGSSRPRGSVVALIGKPCLTVGSGADVKLRGRGYYLDRARNPVFRYTIAEQTIEDAIRVVEKGKGIIRTITVRGDGDALPVTLARASAIYKAGNGRYVVGEREYYLQIEDAGGAKPIIRRTQGQLHLDLDVSGSITYSIFF